MSLSIEKSKEFTYHAGTPCSDRFRSMITSKLTSKSQTTIPQPVRRALNLEPGDRIVFEISEGAVILSKAGPASPVDDPFATFVEWSGEEDDKAYADL